MPEGLPAPGEAPPKGTVKFDDRYDMKKNLLLGLLVLVVIGIGVYLSMDRSAEGPETPRQPLGEKTTFDGRNASFTVNGKLVTLVDGISKTPIENSKTKVVTRYVGNEAWGDLDGDEQDDYAFFFTQDTGGSGTFYYVVAALSTEGGYTTTNAFLVGDRIDPQSIEIPREARELHVNYADRKPGEPMTTQPSEGKVLLLKTTSNGVLEGLMQ